MGRGEDNIKVWNDASPVWWAHNICDLANTVAPPPFLMVHGTRDTLVPVEDARVFATALKEMRRNRGQAVRIPDVYVEVPDALHAFNFTHSPLTYALSDGVARFL